MSTELPPRSLRPCEVRNRYCPSAEMADFIAKRGITYTVLFSDRQLSSTYHISAFPTLFFIDRDGNIAKVHRGYHSSLEASIEEELLQVIEMFNKKEKQQ